MIQGPCQFSAAADFGAWHWLAISYLLPSVSNIPTDMILPVPKRWGGRPLAESEWWRGGDVAPIAPPSSRRDAPTPSLRDREDRTAFIFVQPAFRTLTTFVLALD